MGDDTLNREGAKNAKGEEEEKMAYMKRGFAPCPIFLSFSPCLLRVLRAFAVQYFRFAILEGMM